MSHGIKNEQERGLDVRDDISGKMDIFYMFYDKSLVLGAQIAEIILITDYQAHVHLLQMLQIHIFPNTRYTYLLLKYLEIQKENNSFTIK